MTKSKKRNLFIAILAAFAAAFVLTGALTFSARIAKAESKADVFTVNAGKLSVGKEIEDKFFRKTAIGESDNGIYISQKNAMIDFSYNNAIYFETFDKTRPFIEFYALTGKENVSMIDNLTVTLTDADEPSNTVSVYAYTDYSNYVIYTRVRYNGLDRAVSGETVRDGSYGIYYRNTGFNYGIKRSSTSPIEDWSTKNPAHPFSVSLDYEEKTVYIVTQNRGEPVYYPILDLDNPEHVGADAVWKGFKNGRGKVSVSASFLSDAYDGGVIIKSIAGSNVDGEFTDDASFPAPEIEFDKHTAEYSQVTDGKTYLPDGAKGFSYKIPQASAFDWYYGIGENVSVKIFRGDEEENKEIVGGEFVPDKAGDYRVDYTATNPKASSTKSVFFKIDEEQTPISIYMKEDFGSAALNSEIYIPETDYYGGSGKIIKTEKLFFNGTEIPLNENRTTTIGKVGGTLTLLVECQPYSGETAVKSFSLEIKDDTVLIVSGMPKAVTAGSEVILPEAEAFNGKTGEAADVKIYADGTLLSNDRKLSADGTKSEISVKYVATTALGSKEKEFSVAVVKSSGVTPASYFLSDGSAVVEDGAKGVKISALSGDGRADFAFPVVTGPSDKKTYIILNAAGGANAFGYFDVILSDVSGKCADFFIRIAKDAKNSGKSVIQINGTGESYTVDGTLTDDNSSITLYIENNVLYSTYSSVYVCDLPGYDADLSYISFRFGEAKDNSAVVLSLLANQSMDKAAGKPWSDKTAPVLLFGKQIAKNSEAELGSAVTMPAAEAYDVLSGAGTVTVTVKAPDGSVVVEKRDAKEKLSFVCGMIGGYSVIYEVSDGKNTETVVYTVKACDNVSPSLKIFGKIEEEVVKGTKITLPAAEAEDNADGKLAVYVLIRNLYNYTTIDTKPESEVVLEKCGVYEITYYAHDSNYNYTKYTFTVKVGK